MVSRRGGPPNQMDAPTGPAAVPTGPEPPSFAAGDWEKFPDWTRELISNIAGNVANVFLLYFNVNDLVFVEGHAPLPLQEFLARVLLGITKDQGANAFRALYAYSLSTGLVTPELSGLDGERPPMPRSGGILGGGQDDPVMRELRWLEGALTGATAVPRSLVLVEYLDNLVPTQTQDDRQRSRSEILQRWALHAGIRERRNVVIALTSDKGRVYPDLTSASSGCKLIRVGLPDERDRLRMLRYLQERGQLASLETEGQGWSLETLSAQTAGFSLRHLLALNDLVRARASVRRHFSAAASPSPAHAEAEEPASLGPVAVRRYKRDLIVADSRDLLENFEPRHGFEAVGGLEHIVAELRKVARRIGKSDDSPEFRLIPRGLLFVGPPGTGKTHVAQALAREARMNMVKMKDIRSSWVGESERNLSRVLDLVVDLRPVVVFVDEIDQAIGRRDTGGSGDSGVSARMFGRILEFMGDNANRGRVLWVAASNRPDVLA